MAKTGVKHRILRAKSTGAIATLLKEGESFSFASNSTRKAWKKAAAKRTTELKNESQ